ncbi:sporulation protein Spo3 [Schizosaccharomyces cryophilus OY26]|uniref:Sporulation protein Spo3 n=1 Tax=Schizosaccharomyces cryophilus (strain OY26 / ATCC MYA-4695 / CBS 11777 / NBRC 106824 / NRRL Y48691) TaxID=653667 RepID=S9XD12_SCHCR|nr:sporulation protein Spo3 [Schizosaccharomyces cryophilus OY26]EPY51726.1 sporulation protein Spo3 [Schizosaccharomyces cryophilus OY26]
MGFFNIFQKIFCFFMKVFCCFPTEKDRTANRMERGELSKNKAIEALPKISSENLKYNDIEKWKRPSTPFNTRYPTVDSKLSTVLDSGSSSCPSENDLSRFRIKPNQKLPRPAIPLLAKPSRAYCSDEQHRNDIDEKKASCKSAPNKLTHQNLNNLNMEWKCYHPSMKDPSKFQVEMEDIDKPFPISAGFNSSYSYADDNEDAFLITNLQTAGKLPDENSPSPFTDDMSPLSTSDSLLSASSAGPFNKEVDTEHRKALSDKTKIYSLLDDTDPSSVVDNLSDYSDCFDEFGIPLKTQLEDANSRANYSKIKTSSCFPPFLGHHQSRRCKPNEYRVNKARLQNIKKNCTEVEPIDFFTALQFHNARTVIALYIEWRLRYYETMIVKGEKSLEKLESLRSMPHNFLWLGKFGDPEIERKLNQYDRRCISNSFMFSMIQGADRRTKSDYTKQVNIPQLFKESFQSMAVAASISTAEAKSDRDIRNQILIRKYIPKGDYDFLYAALYHAAYKQESGLKAVSILDILPQDELDDWWYVNLKITSLVTPKICFKYLDEVAKSARYKVTHVEKKSPKVVHQPVFYNILANKPTRDLFEAHELITIAELISLDEPSFLNGEDEVQFYLSQFHDLCAKKREDFRFSPDSVFEQAFRNKHMVGDHYAALPRRGERLEKRSVYYSKYANHRIFMTKSLKRNGSIYEVVSDGLGRVFYGAVLDYANTRNNILLHLGLEPVPSPSEEEIEEHEKSLEQFHNELAPSHSAEYIYEMCGTHSRAAEHQTEVLKKSFFYSADEWKEQNLLKRIISLRILEPTTSVTKFEYELLRTFYPDRLFLNYSKSGKTLTPMQYHKQEQWRRDLYLSCLPMVDENSVLFPYWLKLSCSELFFANEHAAMNSQKPDNINFDIYEPLPETSFMVAAELRVLRNMRHRDVERIPFLDKSEIQALYQLLRKIKKYYIVTDMLCIMRMDDFTTLLQRYECLSCYRFLRADYERLLYHGHYIYNFFMKHVVNVPPKIV